MGGGGSGAIRALSRTKVFLIAADAAAELCKEFLVGRLARKIIAHVGGHSSSPVRSPIGPSHKGNHLVSVPGLSRTTVENYPRCQRRTS